MPVPDLDLPPLYAAVLAVRNERLDQPLTTQQLGAAAWGRLTLDQRREALTHALSAYASTVFYEEREKQLQRYAADPSKSYLQDCDVLVLEGCAARDADEDDYVPADKDALMNVLSELDLLQHRISMRDAEIAELRGEDT